MQLIAQNPDSLWSGEHRRVVAGIFALAFLVAFEALAVATVMPVVAADLDGLGLYALSFAAPTAVAVVSMTVAGPMMDRRGPRTALRAGVGIFAAGLVVAGLAPTMPVFLIGRAVQGLGMGFIGVGLYVVIGQVFPDQLRPRVFTVMTSAWVLPALLGPSAAGLIAEVLGWRWVFLGVPAVAIGSLLLIWRVLQRLDGEPSVVSDRHRVWWAVLTAAGILSISIAGQRSTSWWPLELVVSLLLVMSCAPRLLPAGTWRGRRGLPSVIIARSALGAGYVGAEAYLPLSLVEHRGLSPFQAGLFLTTAAVLWFSGSWLAAHVPALSSKPLRVRLGSLCVLVGIGSGFLTLASNVPVVVAAAVWSIGGLGMGLASPTLAVLLLDQSRPGEHGVNSASLQISGAVVDSLVLALGSVVFAALLSTQEMTGYLLMFGLAALVSAVALLLSTRLEG